MITSRTIIAASALVLTLSSCGDMNDSERTVSEGAGFGALIGGGLAALMGGDKHDIAQAAIIGGGLGAGAGVYVASRKAQYASRAAMISGEQKLIARQVSRTDAATRRVQRASQEMRREVARYNKTSTSAEARKRIAAAGLEAKRRELAAARKALAATDQELKATQATLRAARADGASAREVAGWDAKIRALKTERRELALEIDSYTAGGWR